MNYKYKKTHHDYELYSISHPRIKTRVQQHIIRCFARDLTATETAKIVGKDVRTINPIYQWLRGIISSHYRDFLRFQRYDMDYELMLFLSQSAMMTMYFNTDHRVEWDKHTVLLRSHSDLKERSITEMLQYTLNNKKQTECYQSHLAQNRDWLMDRYIRHRMKKLRSRLFDNEHHVMENIYRFLTTIHVLWHKGIGEEMVQEIKGRHIGFGDNLEKAGVLHIDSMFEKYAFDFHRKIKADMIFSDLMTFLDDYPNA